MVMNQVTVNPPVPLTVLKLRVKGTCYVVVNLICCTGLNVGGKTCNIATIASLKKVSFLFLSSKVYLERSVILFVF